MKDDETLHNVEPDEPFDFSDFHLMQQELNKGNFYDQIKRKSLVMRESLEAKRKEERQELYSFSPDRKKIEV